MYVKFPLENQHISNHHGHRKHLEMSSGVKSSASYILSVFKYSR